MFTFPFDMNVDTKVRNVNSDIDIFKFVRPHYQSLRAVL
jgi:hypothetical protein